MKTLYISIELSDENVTDVQKHIENLFHLSALQISVIKSTTNATDFISNHFEEHVADLLEEDSWNCIANCNEG